MTTVTQLRKLDFASTTGGGAIATQRTCGSTSRAFYLKQALVNAGWIVYYSSNGANISPIGGGTTYYTSTTTLTNNTSDLWTSSGFQAIALAFNTSVVGNAFTMDSIWCCLRSPISDVNGDYLHICLSPSQTQWKDPVVRGPTNAMPLYGVAVIASNLLWYNGSYNAFLRIGMTLSKNTTAFSGGNPVLPLGGIGTTATSATVLGDLPVASNAIWSTHNLGNADALSAGFSGLTVVTNGNQFHVIQDKGSYTSVNRTWFSLCALDAGGYAILEGGQIADGSVPTGIVLLGGRLTTIESPVISIYDFPTQVGGWRTAYIKRAVDNSIWTGGLASPEPVGSAKWYKDTVPVTYRTKLNAISCTNPLHTLGTISDFVMTGTQQINDVTKIVDYSSGKWWFAFKDAKPYLLQWSETEDPLLRTTIIPV